MKPPVEWTSWLPAETEGPPRHSESRHPVAVPGSSGSLNHSGVFCLVLLGIGHVGPAMSLRFFPT